MTTLEIIEKLIRSIATDAMKADTPLESKMDALKIIAPYYVTLAKGREKVDDTDEPTIGDIQRRLHVVDQEAEDGGNKAGTIPARNRR